MNGFLQEVCTQGALLRDTVSYYSTSGMKLMDEVATIFVEKGMDRVILTGMGSSLYATDCIRSYLTSNGIPAHSYSSFELSRFQFGQVTPKTLVIAISQSGNSKEVVELVEKAKAVTTVVGIFNNEGSKLSELAHIAIPIRAGKETSITNKTYELTMLILNILARRLCQQLDEDFWKQAQEAAQWCSDWLDHYEEYTKPMFDFAQGTVLYDLLANDTSLATARQLSLAYREGLHNCTAVWECADYAHGQYYSARMAHEYLAQMFIPVFQEGTHEMRMCRYILDQGGRVILYTSSDVPEEKGLYVVKMPQLPSSLMPLMESVASETLLGMLLGPDWVKGR